MKTSRRFADYPIRRQQWLALALAAGGGVALCVLLGAGLRPMAASAASQAEPAVNYACSEAGLNSALAAGGSATFSCGVPTTITVSGRKTVAHTGTLDGGNKLTLSGGGFTGVFTVTTGVHLSLLNLTIRDARSGSGAAIYNHGALNTTHVTFFNNSAPIGAALYNAPGALANLADTSVISNSSTGGALWNGDRTVPISASLAIAGSTFSRNMSSLGAAIYNDLGSVTVTASSFTLNASAVGGAIFNNAWLRVDDSRFVGNSANGAILNGPSAPGSLPQAPAVALPNGGGAIYVTNVGDAIIHGSSFTSNLGIAAGGAIFYGLLPVTTVLSDVHRVAIDSSSFYANCTGGEGGAVAASLHAAVSNSTFQNNVADANAIPCAADQTSLLGGRPLAAPAEVQADPIRGSGGAIFTSYILGVGTSSFISNTATITTAEGGGALDNYPGGSLSVSSSAFNDNVSNASGGAILNDTMAAAVIVGSDFNHNRATGFWGGAISNFGALTVNGSNFTANHQTHDTDTGGGAIFSQAGFVLAAAGPNGPGPGLTPHTPLGPGTSNFLTVDHSTFTANTSQNRGGALYAGPALVSNSSFISNSAPDGGAINVLGPFTATADTFYGNVAITTTYQNALQGGAVDTNAYQMLIVNSTFYRNRAEGLALGGALKVNNPIVSAGTDAASGTIDSVTILYSTFLSNTADTPGHGGAIFQASSQLSVLTGVLLAYNTGGDCNNNVVFSGANLEFGDATCGPATLTSNPHALSPAHNGGSTLTSALLPGSPAINAGNLGCPATDQRGAHRPVGTHCDIGAFEFGGSVPWLWLPLVRR